MKINQAVQISAMSKTDSGEMIAYFNATVADADSSSVMTIKNQALYDANKKQVRQDKADFDAYVYDVEDKQTPQA
jgi:hypothetical protein